MEIVLVISGLWFVFGLIGAAMGQKKGESVSGFFAGAIFGPLGLLMVLESSGDRRPCPFCQTKVSKKASICPACRSGLPVYVKDRSPAWQKYFLFALGAVIVMMVVVSLFKA